MPSRAVPSHAAPCHLAASHRAPRRSARSEEEGLHTAGPLDLFKMVQQQLGAAHSTGVEAFTFRVFHSPGPPAAFSAVNWVRVRGAPVWGRP